MKRSATFILLALIAVGASSPSFAQDGDDRKTPTQPNVTQQGDILPISEISARLTQQGYKIKEIEMDDGRYEVEARTAEGRKVELDVDPRTGEITGREDD